MKKLPYSYIPEFSLQILELPYVDEELSMFILLPQESTDDSDPLLKVQNLQTATSMKRQFFFCIWSLLVNKSYVCSHCYCQNRV